MPKLKVEIRSNDPQEIVWALRRAANEAQGAVGDGKQACGGILYGVRYDKQRGAHDVAIGRWRFLPR